jgi:hypothetical protein
MSMEGRTFDLTKIHCPTGAFADHMHKITMQLELFTKDSFQLGVTKSNIDSPFFSSLVVHGP